ncbi:hypothetical protein KY334_02570 [Candidatus Woesearchaeota archaeon]|nr:hypothetical protein [Candidatus Woesearchaeota archaeon]
MNKQKVQVDKLFSIKDEFNKSIENLAINIYNRFLEKFELLGIGRNRIVFGSKNYVYKIPRNRMGFYDNSEEARLKDECYAICRLILINDIPILVMERLDLNIDEKKLPIWVDFIDCQQVGLSKHGELKAYDYAT